MAREAATPDLLSWEPEEPVRRFDERRVRSATLRGQVARAVAELLRDAAEAGQTRIQVAKAASEWLGEEISKGMLDAYASEAREEHSISVVRLMALVHATGDVRPLEMLAELFGCAVVENRFLPWIELGQLADVKVEIDRRYETLRRAARKKRTP